MADYKVRKGVISPSKLPIENWTTDQMCIYVSQEFLKAYKVETRRPIGQIKIHVNQKHISTLFRLEGRSINIHPNELYKQFIDWIIARKTVKNFRIWYLSKQEIMVDFLDERAEKLMKTELGSVEEFDKQEEQKNKEALKYYERLESD